VQDLEDARLLQVKAQVLVDIGRKPLKGPTVKF
jgi:hypothetical protein